MVSTVSGSGEVEVRSGCAVQARPQPAGGLCLTQPVSTWAEHPGWAPGLGCLPRENWGQGNIGP